MSVCTHMNRDLKVVLWMETESYKQDYVYNNSHIDVCFEIPKVDYDYGRGESQWGKQQYYRPAKG